MTGPVTPAPPAEDRLHEFADSLYAAGFYAVSHAVRSGRMSWADALDHVRVRALPEGPWNPHGQRLAQAVLERWDHDPHL